MPLTDLLRRHGEPEAPAIIFEGVLYTRRRLLAQVAEAAAALRIAGVSRGSKTILALPNGPEFVVSLLAVNECGGVVIPLNPALPGEERQRIERCARAEFVIGRAAGTALFPGVGVSRSAQRTAATGLHDVAAIIFTSGTTGAPKGVMLSEAALLINASAVAAYLRLSPVDRSLVFLPLSYAYALSQVLSSLTAGAGVVLLRDLRYPALAFQAMKEHRVTGFGGVPTSLAILARHQRTAGVRVDSLRYMLSAGGPLSSDLLHTLLESFPGVAVFNNYGCTEIGPRATALDCLAHPQKIGSIGRAIPGVRATILDADGSVAGPGETGEIALSGPSLMKGYYDDPVTTSARMSRHGFLTGDYGYIDEEGFLYYQGRQDDIFKSAGEKVSASEVEDVVLAHQDIAEAAVVSQPDAMFGAVPVAYVVLQPGTSCTDRDIQAFCASRLARHKVPRAVYFVGELRKTGSGKVQKQWLRQTSQR
jgi:acyl-coenzyme A synthetase/AMP-(fatty) acid ligase